MEQLENIEDAIWGREVIAQATGVMMSRYDCDLHQGFARLRQLAEKSRATVEWTATGVMREAVG